MMKKFNFYLSAILIISLIVVGCGTKVYSQDLSGEAIRLKIGNLFVNSTPAGANAYVDDSFKGLTP